MKRVILSLLLAVCIFSSLSATPRTYTPTELAVIAFRSMVVVEADKGNGTSLCAGFVIDAAKGLAVTAAHCVLPDAEFVVNGSPSEIVKRTESLLLVRIPNMYQPALRLRTKDLQLGERITSAGYGWGDRMVLVRYVSQIHGLDFAMDGSLVPGMSGGPILDEFGDVVGINQASDNVLSVACGQDEIRDLLK